MADDMVTRGHALINDPERIDYRRARLSSLHEWSVYEHSAGRVWHVTPATEEQAHDQAGHFSNLDGYLSHEAMHTTRALELANAFAAGRIADRRVH